MTLAEAAIQPAVRSPAAIARTLAPVFADRAAQLDQSDQFAAENFAELRASGLVEAGVPSALGGGGAPVRELAEMLRILGQACGSTALAFSMHTHQVAIPAWRWTVQKAAPVEPLLKRIAAERIIVLSSGGADWISGSGTATKTEGGYLISATKINTSASPIGDLLMTGAVLTEDDGSRHVLHFGVPMKSDKVKVLDTWHTLGMRGTGSHDVQIDGLFIADAAVALKRPAGQWHPLFQIITTIAFPLIYSAYLGVAEQAREIALKAATGRAGASTVRLVGEMETALRAAQLAVAHMIDVAERDAPSAETVNDCMMGRTLAAENAIRTVELAMEVAGGGSFYNRMGLERCFRDIQGARFHPMQRGPQAIYAGSMALGLPISTVY